jgi:peptide chain release factor 2
MQDLLKQFEELLTKVRAAIDKLKLPADEVEIERLQVETNAPDFWNEPQEAARVSQRLAELTKHTQSWRQLEKAVSDECEALGEFGTDPDYLISAKTNYATLSSDYASREFELKLSGPHDRSSAIVEIHAGTGGTDAQDWAQMLERMYLRYAERAGFKTEILSRSEGEEAGIKSVTFEVNGNYAFGRLKGEKGVHRLVRLSPFNADNLRQTSFALVEVIPQLEAKDKLEIDPKDLRIDVYRSGGNGGQSVNTTDSAVRITHLPTGLVVAIQNERSQLQNKEKAMAILNSRLATLMEEQHKAELAELRGPSQSVAWGNQIRSYVLHPYTKVKDSRSGYETSQAADVLDGELEGLIEAGLQSKIGSSGSEA